MLKIQNLAFRTSRIGKMALIFGAMAAMASAIGAGTIGIPIRFDLPKAGYVTLVVEDSQRQRVRNLIAETKLLKGTGFDQRVAESRKFSYLREYASNPLVDALILSRCSRTLVVQD
ncbi:MAG TPA: hypothetical protein VKY92_06805 [Verrucomicrobiae bacterium]|nr:hypothetical protein [Verrucomicrobiae bacterium]